MRRREVLAGALGLAVVGGGAAVTLGDWDPLDEPGEVVEPVDLEGIDAPGSDAATITVPERGRVTYVEVFATWCTTCKRMMPDLAAAHERVDDVQFVSITYEPLGDTVTEEDIAEWWADNGGEWQVAHDQGLVLSAELDASSLPHSAVLDAENRLVWTDYGHKTADELVEQIEGA